MANIMLIIIILSLGFVIVFFGRRAHRELKLLRTAEDEIKLKEYYGALLWELGFMSGGIDIVVVFFSIILYYNYGGSLPTHIDLMFTVTLSIEWAYLMLMSSYVSSVTSKLKNGRTQDLNSAFKSNLIDTVLSTTLDMIFLYIISYIDMWISIITLYITLIMKTLIIVEICIEKPEEVHLRLVV